jgi:pimeloyl-ACP methyl ester carboxylesterase
MEKSFDELYQNVPKKQRNRLINFRREHDYKTIIFKGKTWDFIDTEKGKKNLLFLTGGTRIGEAFALLPFLEEKFRVISPTYPILYTIDELVQGINNIVEQLSIEKFNIFGTSLGGMITQEYIRRNLKKIEKVIIANTAPPLPEYGIRGQFFVFLSYILPNFYVKKLTKKSLVRMWEEAKEEDKEFWLAYCEELIQNSLPKRWITAQFKLSNDFGLYNYKPNDLGELQKNMLIINSEDDETFDMNLQKKLMSLYPKAKVHTLKNAGHTPMVNNREEYLKVIFDFLEK